MSASRKAPVRGVAALTGPAPATPATPARRPASRFAPALAVLRLLTIGGLVADVWVHAHLAPAYDGIKATVSQGDLFRVEAAAAALAVVLLALSGRWWSWALALGVATAGTAAVLVYNWVDIGAFGPFPDMYDPVWFTEKTVSLVGEALAAATAGLGLLLSRAER